MPSHIYEQVVKAHLRTAVHRPLDDDTLAAYLAPWQGDGGQAAYFRKIAQWTEDDVGVVERLLPRLDVPVRIVWGEHDGWLDRSIAERLARMIPGAELRLIPGAGHFAPEDAPEAIAAELADFFAAEPSGKGVPG
jgi:pimeloyl-ACP methyl ester carboxylesterase